MKFIIFYVKIYKFLNINLFNNDFKIFIKNIYNKKVLFIIFIKLYILNLFLKSNIYNILNLSINNK